MLLTYDVEDYKKNPETGKYEPELDATGKHFILGCVYKETGGKKVFTEKEQLWKYLLKIGRSELKRGKKLTCYAHNAKFDFYQIADLKDKNLRFFAETPFIASYYLPVEREFKNKEEFKRWEWYAKREKIEYKILTELGDMIIIEYKKEAIKFLDTLAIFHMPLKKIGEMIGFPKQEMPTEIGERLTKTKIKEIAKYCMRDCEVTMKAIRFLKDKLAEENLKIRNLCTINQIAISYVLNKLRKAEAKQILYVNRENKVTDMTWNTKYKNDIHSAYRGGFVRAWNTGVFEGVTSIDANSLYPYSATIMDFPDLRTERKIYKPLEKMNKEELLSEIGISRAMIINKSNELGLLPIRLPEKSYSPKKGKIMIGTWTNKELKVAEKEGYKIIGIEWSILWNKAENPLKPIYEKTFKKRIESDNKFNGWFYKAMMNSSIGKFGQRRTDQMIVIDSMDNVYKYLEKNFKMVRGIKESNNVIYINKDIGNGKPKKYYAPIIPALITAEARINMYYHYSKIPKKDLLYTDTDSIIMKGNYINRYKIGKEMGKFKVDKDIITGEKLINKRAIIWGTKSKAVGNNIAVSGVFKSGLTLNDFQKGQVIAKKMLGLKSITENRVGEFIIEKRDLKKQQKDFWKGERKLAKEKIYIDFDVDDILFFKDKILSYM